MFFEAGQITGDGILDIPHRRLARLALRNATGQRGTFRHKNSVLVRLNVNATFHVKKLAASGFIASAIKNPTFGDGDEITEVAQFHLYEMIASTKSVSAA